MLGQETPIVGDYFHAQMLGVVLLTCNKLCVIFLRGSPLKSLKQWIFLGGGSLIGIEIHPRNLTWIPKMMLWKGIERVTRLRHGCCGYLYVKLEWE